MTWSKIVIIIIVAVIISVLIFKNSPEQTNSVWFNDVKVDNDRIELKGMLANSSKVFKGYEYYIKDKELYLRIFTKTPIWGKGIQGGGNLTIKIDKGDSTIEKVFFLGQSSKDIKLLWEKSKR
ncbi:MAG: hypothetical protein WA118_13500 [Carboxydocellales bacterium]